MVLNSCASRSPRRFLSASMRRLLAAVSGHGQALREKIIAGVAGGDFDQVGFPAQADDVLNQDDFSFCHKNLTGLKWNVVFFRPRGPRRFRDVRAAWRRGGGLAAGGAGRRGASAGRGCAFGAFGINEGKAPSRTTLSLLRFWWVSLSSHVILVSSGLQPAKDGLCACIGR